MKITPYIILALITAAGVQKLGNRPVDPTLRLLTVEAEQPLLGDWSPFALRKIKTEEGQTFTQLSYDAGPAEIGVPFCAEVSRGRLLGDMRLARGAAKACG